MRLFKLLRSKQKEENFTLLADTVLELGVVYYRGRSEIKGASKKGIKLIEWFLTEKDWSVFYDPEDYVDLLIGLYCNKNDPEGRNKAIELINNQKALTESEKVEKINYVNNKECWKLVVYDK
jgi:hypothetical protein